MKNKKIVSLILCALFLSSSLWAQTPAPAASPVPAVTSPAPVSPSEPIPAAPAVSNCKQLMKDLKKHKKNRNKVSKIKKQMKQAGCKVSKKSAPKSKHHHTKSKNI